MTETKQGTESLENSSTLIATTDNAGRALKTSTPTMNSTWIIDYGATNHMTFDSRQVSPLKPSSLKNVSTANGASTSVIGEGSLSLTNTLKLELCISCSFI